MTLNNFFTMPSQLLAITIDDVNNKLLDLFAYESLRKGENFVDELYNANASVIVNDSKIFRFECVSSGLVLNLLFLV